MLLALAFERRVREDLGRQVIPTPGNADTDGIGVRRSLTDSEWNSVTPSVGQHR